MPSDHTAKKSGSFFGLLKKGSSKEILGRRPALFGLELNALNCLENGIPQPIKECLEFLESRCDTEGLFRVSASIKDVDMARSNNDNGIPICFRQILARGHVHHTS